ncbi:transmembrane protein, putative (macronuclear) [Tetrahymena thermophila SB210]|uniref:Transmembrane protein, putative n=1 Tax=Tetrahymena thermophila (strain SB210) TaxID=312017 RepID=W7X866_TETTS|nr:transmembrane protein, putative [Tetrahymena thermophila SB210]EWS73542.1 transmembrane protein, putative [Tetrahymena thermophila SB210]|eukprot:XP_012653932.1 transmembrane protein, putative [Tetrahymena thermophila SB210]
MNSEYFKVQSYLLIVLGISLIAISIYIFKIFSNKQAYVSTKKLSIVFLKLTCLSIAIVSLSYLIRVYAINWCGYVITFNGPVSEVAIKNTLNMNAICLESSYEEKLQSIKNTIFQLCNHNTSCQEGSYSVTSFTWIFSLCFLNLCIFMVLDFYIFIYIYQKIHYAEFDASQKAQSLENLKKSFLSDCVSISIDQLSQQIQKSNQQDTCDSHDFTNRPVSQIEMTNAEKSDDLSEHNRQVKNIISINSE